MASVKLQYSIICQRDEKDKIIKIIPGFRPGKASFFVTNKWVWDTGDIEEDGFFQLTEILKNGEVIAVSRSEYFNVKMAHTHHNYFENISFGRDGEYRVRVNLFNKEGEGVKEASLEYPIFVK